MSAEDPRASRSRAPTPRFKYHSHSSHRGDVGQLGYRECGSALTTVSSAAITSRLPATDFSANSLREIFSTRASGGAGSNSVSSGQDIIRFSAALSSLTLADAVTRAFLAWAGANACFPSEGCEPPANSPAGTLNVFVKATNVALEPAQSRRHHDNCYNPEVFLRSDPFEHRALPRARLMLAPTVEIYQSSLTRARAEVGRDLNSGVL